MLGVRLARMGLLDRRKLVLRAVRKVPVVQNMLERLHQLTQPGNQGEDEEQRQELPEEVAEAHRGHSSVLTAALHRQARSDERTGADGLRPRGPQEAHRRRTGEVQRQLGPGRWMRQMRVCLSASSLRASALNRARAARPAPTSTRLGPMGITSA